VVGGVVAVGVAAAAIGSAVAGTGTAGATATAAAAAAGTTAAATSGVSGLVPATAVPVVGARRPPPQQIVLSMPGRNQSQRLFGRPAIRASSNGGMFVGGGWQQSYYGSSPPFTSVAIDEPSFGYSASRYARPAQNRVWTRPNF
jgi:hypothetical protein